MSTTIRRVISVTFEDGTTASVSDDDLRAYLRNRELQAKAKKRGWNLTTTGLHSALKKLARDAGRIDTLRKVQETHSADARRTEKALREAERRLKADPKTPRHRVRTLAAEAAGITRTRANQILGPVKKPRKAKGPS